MKTEKMTWNEFQHAAQLFDWKNPVEIDLLDSQAAHKAITYAVINDDGYTFDRMQLIAFAYQKYYK